MAKIKFSHMYEKMPPALEHGEPTMLLEVFIKETNELSQDFVLYDTLYGFKENGDMLLYELPKGKVLILLLRTADYVWTTIRRWTPQKEEYYTDLRGQEVEIVVND